MKQSPRKAWKEAIEEYSKELRLPMIRNHLEEHIQEANQADISYEEFLAHLLEKECDARQESARYNRIRRAEFTHKRYLEDLHVEYLPEDAQKKLKQLKTLDFIREGRNLNTAMRLSHLCHLFEPSIDMKLSHLGQAESHYPKTAALS